LQQIDLCALPQVEHINLNVAQIQQQKSTTRIILINK